MKKITITMLSLIIFSCEKDLDIKLDFEGTRLAVSCLISPRDSVQVYVVKTNDPFLQNYEIEDDVVPKAQITFLENGVSVGEFKFDTLSNYYKSEFVPSIGSEYQLIVQVEGFDQVNSEIIQIPENKEVEVVLDKDSDPNTNKINITFNDAINQTNTYGIVVRPKFIPFGFNYVVNQIYIDNCNFYQGGIFGVRGYVFDDICFNGSEAAITINTQDVRNGSEFELIFYTIDKNIFQFSKALSQYRQENFGTSINLEPIRIPTSFSNSYGVFGAYNYTITSVD